MRTPQSQQFMKVISNLFDSNGVNEPRLSFSAISAMFERVWIGLHKLLMNSLYSKNELNPQDYHGNFEERVPRICSNQPMVWYPSVNN